MRKMYSKPEILFESFSMNVSIAACGIDTDLPTKGVCGIPFGTDVLFDDSISQCNYPVEDGYANHCYHNPSDITRLFGS